jgi:hypothetical protein
LPTVWSFETELRNKKPYWGFVLSAAFFYQPLPKPHLQDSLGDCFARSASANAITFRGGDFANPPATECDHSSVGSADPFNWLAIRKGRIKNRLAARKRPWRRSVAGWTIQF